MTAIPKSCLGTLFLILISFVAAGSGRDTGSILIRVIPVFASEQIVSSEKAFHSAEGYPLYIDEFRFYLSAISFKSVWNEFAEQNSYHLVDAADNASQVFQINGVKAGSYHTISLSIGVDSLTNVSGALDGDLDPTLGMYWTWNTGYINAKLSGRSSACKTLHQAFEFHIGGYSPPYNALRKVTLGLQDFSVRPGEATEIEIIADAAAWLEGPARIDLSLINNVVIPGKESMQIADNYADMLRVKTTVP